MYGYLLQRIMAENVDYGKQLAEMKAYMESRFMPLEGRQEILGHMRELSERSCEEYPEICSIVTAGSLTRGDFILGTSDFDIAAVFYGEPCPDAIDTLRTGAEKGFSKYFGHSAHGKWAYDLQSARLDQIPRENKNPEIFCPLGLFNYRAFDTKECGVVLCGENILKDLVVRDPKPDSPERIQRLFLMYNNCPSKEPLEIDIWKIIHTGDIIKAAQIYFGGKTYFKTEVLEGFVDCVPDFEGKVFIFDFFEEYLDLDYFSKNDKASFMKRQTAFLSGLLDIFGIGGG
jgi:hypothetical protein